VSTNARMYVEPPTFTPSPYGLTSVVDFRPDGSPHWQAGVTWVDVCGGSGTYSDYCLTSSPAITGSGSVQAKGSTTGRSQWGATPFTVYAEIDCSPVDFYENQDAVITAALARYESYEVERTFWTGNAATKNGSGGTVNGVLPHLASNAQVLDSATGTQTRVILQQAATIVTGTAVNVVTALGLLEGALANCLNGTGIIHVPQSISPVMAGLGLIRQSGQQFRTINGNLVAIGAGYPGTAPDGSAPGLGAGWLYATGPIFAYRSAPKLLSANGANIDRSTNTVKAIVERNWLLGYDCCLFAVKVNDASVIAVSTTTP
jgi:hypothetical protein